MQKLPKTFTAAHPQECYALVKRGRKQFRRSLKTTDRSLANRKLADLCKKIATLTLSGTRSTNFEAVAKAWLDSQRHALRGQNLSASSFVQELDTLRLILDYAMSKGLLLDS